MCYCHLYTISPWPLLIETVLFAVSTYKEPRKVQLLDISISFISTYLGSLDIMRLLIKTVLFFVSTYKESRKVQLIEICAPATDIFLDNNVSIASYVHQVLVIYIIIL